jgi:hypothetical protein
MPINWRDLKAIEQSIDRLIRAMPSAALFPCTRVAVTATNFTDAPVMASSSKSIASFFRSPTGASDKPARAPETCTSLGTSGTRPSTGTPQIDHNNIDDNEWHDHTAHDEQCIAVLQDTQGQEAHSAASSTSPTSDTVGPQSADNHKDTHLNRQCNSNVRSSAAIINLHKLPETHYICESCALAIPLEQQAEHNARNHPPPPPGKRPIGAVAQRKHINAKRPKHSSKSSGNHTKSARTIDTFFSRMPDS